MDVGTAVGVVSLGIQVCQSLLEYYNAYKDFHEDIRRTYQIIAHLNATLNEINQILNDVDGDRKEIAANAVVACNENIGKLEKKAKKLRSYDPKGLREKFTIQLQRAFYPFRQSTLVKLREITADTQDQVSLALQVLQLDIGIESQKTANGVAKQFQDLQLRMDDVSQQTQETLNLARKQNQQRDLSIYDWLAKPDYAAQQMTHIRDHLPGTGSWLIESSKFQDWIHGTGKFLFLHGSPGVGKTTLSSMIIEHLQTQCEQSNEGLCYFYCDFNRRNEQQLEKILLCFTRQLAESLGDLPACIAELYNKHSPRRTTPNIGEATQTLYSVARNYSRFYIIVDALDECLETSGIQKELIDTLLELNNANVLLTSRPLPSIMSIITTGTILEILADDEEIGRYVNENIKHLPNFVVKSSSLQDLVRSSIVEAVCGVYLLAKLLINSLKGARSPKHLRGTLKSFSTGNDAYTVAYSKTLDRINSQLDGQRQLALEALTWIVFTHRPIKTFELLYALAIELDEPEFDQENIPDLDQVVTSCLGLVSIEEDTQVIRLAHQTIQEYFKSNGSTWLGDGHDKITRSCLWYLSMDPFKSGICNRVDQLKRRFHKYPFYAYASGCWGYHTNDSEDFSAVDKFLKLYKHVQAASQALIHGWTISRYSYPIRLSNVTGLHLATEFNSTKLVLHVLENEDINAQDSDGETALSYAARGGYTDLVRLLLSKGAKIHNLTQENSDPLLNAAESGNLEVVTALLDDKAEINAQNLYGHCALSLAIACGHEDVVKLLIERGAQLELKNRRGKTPLHIAADEDNVSITRLLIQAGAQMESKDNLKHTPLQSATSNRCLAVAALLIDAGAQFDVLDKKPDVPRWDSYQKAGLLAALLSEKDDGPEDGLLGVAERSINGALFMPVNSNREQMTRLIFGEGWDFMHEVVDGISILHLAAYIGHLKVVRYLLELEAEVFKTNSAVAPLSVNVARQNILPADSTNLTKSTIDTSTTSNTGLLSILDGVGKSALHYAALGGSIEVLDYLLDKGMDRDAKDKHGRTILHYASMSITAQMVSHVLEFESLIDKSCGYDILWSPLHWACREGDFDIIKVLVDAGFKSTTVSTTNPPFSWTPMDLAVYFGNTDLVTYEGELIKAHPWATLTGSGLMDIDAREVITMCRANDLGIGTERDEHSCYACKIEIIGISFSCRTCKDLTLCFMCRAEPETNKSLHCGHDWKRYEGSDTDGESVRGDEDSENEEDNADDDDNDNNNNDDDEEDGNNNSQEDIDHKNDSIEDEQ